MSIQENINKIVSFCFTLQLLNKLYHWNTTSFARHKATDEFNTSLSSILDQFTEVYIGRYNVKPVVTHIDLDESYLSDDNIVNMFITVRNQLQQFETELMIRDTDLLNIRDELLAAVNKTLYLFNLK
jgi:DNA-binding ferritin-like protein